MCCWWRIIITEFVGGAEVVEVGGVMGSAFGDGDDVVDGEAGVGDGVVAVFGEFEVDAGAAESAGFVVAEPDVDGAGDVVAEFQIDADEFQGGWMGGEAEVWLVDAKGEHEFGAEVDEPLAGVAVDVGFGAGDGH